jgi:hypothetical protein
MSQAHPPDDTSGPSEESPIAWFAEMVLAWDRRDIDRAAAAKRQLARLGWSVVGSPRPVQVQERGTR